MFIYILAHDCEYKEDLEDMVCVVSTDFQKILDYLTVDRARYLGDYELFVCKDGDIDESGSIYLNTDVSNYLRKYPPTVLAKDKETLDDLVSKTQIWCDNIKFQLEEKRRMEQEEKNKKQEEKDRILYEKLKAKFES